MSYNNFAPTFWAEKILRNNEKLLVLANLANREFEGQAKKGERVKILGVGSVTVKDYARKDIDSPETLEDTSIYLDIDNEKYFNVEIDDIDKAQSKGNALDLIMDEASESMADEEDTSIGAVLLGAVKITPKTDVNVSNSRNVIIGAKTALRKNGVKKTTKICATVTPDFFEKLEIRNEELNTNNSSDMENGFDAKVSGVEIYVSNNLPRTKDDKDVLFIFTKGRAFAHAVGVDEVEAYRPEKRFSDAIKGLQCYGTKVVRPKELIAYSVAYQA